MKKLILMLMLCAPMTMMAQKFGKVNTQQIMQSLPDVAKANGEMEALQKQKENDLKSMQDEFQRKADEYQKGSSTMNATAKQQKETADSSAENSAGLPGWSAGVAEEEQRTHAAYRSKGTYSYRGSR